VPDALRGGSTNVATNAAPHLTARHREIIRLMATGDDQATICRELGMALNTLKNHMSAIYRLTGTQSNLQLLAWYFHRQVHAAYERGCREGPAYRQGVADASYRQGSADALVAETRGT
jgi:DNA-binding CsgD family transcriptional regulator